MKKIICLFFMVMLLSGCAINSGVIPMGKDTYKVSHQAASGFNSSYATKCSTLSEAKQFCVDRGKSLKVLFIEEHHPPYIFGNFPKAEVQFMCLDANDSRLIKDNEEVNIQLSEDLTTKIKTLNKLLSDGFITQREFEERKQKLLDVYTAKKN